MCDDGYWRFGKEDESDCATLCPGNSDQICGGYYRNSVYELEGSWKNGNGKLTQPSNRLRLSENLCCARSMVKKDLEALLKIKYDRNKCVVFWYCVFLLRTVGDILYHQNAYLPVRPTVPCRFYDIQSLTFSSLRFYPSFAFISAGGEATYIGCYVDQTTRAFSHKVYEFSALKTLTLYSCLAMCKGLGYTYAGRYSHWNVLISSHYSTATWINIVFLPGHSCIIYL